MAATAFAAALVVLALVALDLTLVPSPTPVTTPVSHPPVTDTPTSARAVATNGLYALDEAVAVEVDILAHGDGTHALDPALVRRAVLSVPGARAVTARVTRGSILLRATTSAPEPLSVCVRVDPAFLADPAPRVTCPPAA